jgi:hypothetical protein
MMGNEDVKEAEVRKVRELRLVRQFRASSLYKRFTAYYTSNDHFV